MSNIINFPRPKYGPIPVEDVIQGAVEAKMKDIVIIGYDENGMEYFASSNADGGVVLWLLERLKKMLLEVPERMTETIERP